MLMLKKTHSVPEYHQSSKAEFSVHIYKMFCLNPGYESTILLLNIVYMQIQHPIILKSSTATIIFSTPSSERPAQAHSPTFVSYLPYGPQETFKVSMKSYQSVGPLSRKTSFQQKPQRHLQSDKHYSKYNLNIISFFHYYYLPLRVFGIQTYGKFEILSTVGFGQVCRLYNTLILSYKAILSRRLYPSPLES